MKKLGINLSLLLFFAFSANSEPIKIPLHNWSSQQVGATLLGMLFQMVGEEIEFVSINSIEVYDSLCDNEIDIIHEIWEGAFGPSFQSQLDKDCAIEIGKHDINVREGWWYPNYVKELCPGLPDYQALNSCSNIFSLKETGSKGAFISGPKIWKKNDTKRIRSLGIDFEVVHKDTASEIWVELAKAIKNEKPIIVFNWTPNFVEATYEGEFVKFPDFEPACLEDPTWGKNIFDLYDCGNPLGGYIKIGSSKNFKENHPRAFEVAKNIKFTNLDISQFAQYPREGLNYKLSAEKWLDNNEDRWKSWIE